MSNEYLKDSYKWQLRAVLIANVAVFWGVVVSRANFSAMGDLFSSLSIDDGIIGVVAPVATFILNGLVSADYKARVVYWRYRHPLPGSRAFSVHLERETRADPDRLARHWGPLPSKAVEENRLWYRIYKSVENDLGVHEAHRAWLFSRDLTAYVLLFLGLFGIASLVSAVPSETTGWYILLLVSQYLAVMIAARNYGVRFVRTVLAVASLMEVSEETSQN